MKKISAIVLLLISLLPVFGDPVQSSSVQKKNDGTAVDAQLNLKLALNSASYYQMGFTESSIIDDTLISLTSINLVPEFVPTDSAFKTNSNMKLQISDDSKSVRGYWLIFGSESFDINIRLSTLAGKRDPSHTLSWQATWKSDDNADVTATGGGTAVLFHRRNYRENHEIESSGSKPVVFDITSDSFSLDALYIDAYRGYITMEVVAL